MTPEPKTVEVLPTARLQEPKKSKMAILEEGLGSISNETFSIPF